MVLGSHTHASPPFLRLATWVASVAMCLQYFHQCLCFSDMFSCYIHSYFPTTNPLPGNVSCCKSSTSTLALTTKGEDLVLRAVNTNDRVRGFLRRDSRCLESSVILCSWLVHYTCWRSAWRAWLIHVVKVKNRKYKLIGNWWNVMMNGNINHWIHYLL